MSTGQRGGTIVVGVDGSEPALQAVRWAAAEAVRRRVPLRVVTAFGWIPDHALGQGVLGARYREIMLGKARGYLAAAVALAEQESPGLEVEQQLVVGYPIGVLSSESGRAQLVVIGDRGLGGVTGLLVGSVAVGLVVRAECPVVVVRGEEAQQNASLPVAVGVDGSPNSESALAFAYEEAATRGVPLVAVHILWDLPVELDVVRLAEANIAELDVEEVLAERLAGWSEKYPDVRAQRLVAHDHPARALVEESGRAQLLVVGSRGRGGISGLVLGSVSHAVLHRAHCPVAVVRPDTRTHE
ncbi:MAG TPA: universal stress protein [Pseudonocardia sp.]